MLSPTIIASVAATEGFAIGPDRDLGVGVHQHRRLKAEYARPVRNHLTRADQRNGNTRDLECIYKAVDRLIERNVLRRL